jgi:hypothetical protein
MVIEKGKKLHIFIIHDQILFAQSKSQFSSYMHVGKKILICKAHPKYTTNFKQNL